MADYGVITAGIALSGFAAWGAYRMTRKKENSSPPKLQYDPPKGLELERQNGKLYYKSSAKVKRPMIVIIEEEPEVEQSEGWHEEIMELVNNEGLDTIIALESDCFCYEFTDTEEEEDEFYSNFDSLQQSLTTRGMTPEVGQVALAFTSILHLRMRRHYEPSVEKDYKGLITMFPMLVSRATAGMSSASVANQAATNLISLITEEYEYVSGEQHQQLAQ